MSQRAKDQRRTQSVSQSIYQSVNQSTDVNMTWMNERGSEGINHCSMNEKYVQKHGVWRQSGRAPE
jgi:hypothetical protein